MLPGTPLDWRAIVRDSLGRSSSTGPNDATPLASTGGQGLRRASFSGVAVPEPSSFSDVAVPEPSSATSQEGRSHDSAVAASSPLRLSLPVRRPTGRAGAELEHPTGSRWVFGTCPHSLSIPLGLYCWQNNISSSTGNPTHYSLYTNRHIRRIVHESSRLSEGHA